jgi:hypothetical protein
MAAHPRSSLASGNAEPLNLRSGAPQIDSVNRAEFVTTGTI